jgi:hypothetical protein
MESGKVDRPVQPEMTMPSRSHAWMITAPLVLCTSLASAESWLDTRATIETLAETENFSAAIALGDDLVAKAGVTFGKSSSEAADAELLLAQILREAGEPRKAAERISNAIEILRPMDTRDSMRLVDATVALGMAYAAADAPALAVVAFESAKALTRRKLGLLNERQIGILYLMAAAAHADRDYEGAMEYRAEAVEVAQRSRLRALHGIERTHGRSSAEFIDGQLGYASWLGCLGETSDARVAYLDTLELVEGLGEPPALTVRVLREMAWSLGSPWTAYDGLGNMVSGAPRELARARRVVNRMPEPDPALRAALLRDLGDWQLLVGRANSTAKAYRKASELLAGIEGGEELRLAWFEETQAIQPPGNQLLRSGLLTLAPNDPRGHVDVTFLVDSTGRASDIVVTGAEPEWLTDTAVRQIANARFRPQLENGELVAAPGRYTWDFRYDPAVAEGLGLTNASRVIED